MPASSSSPRRKPGTIHADAACDSPSAAAGTAAVRSRVTTAAGTAAVRKKVTIHTDGACEGNPGPGGWAAVLEHGGRTKEIAGGVPATTNNRMELQAAIAALNALKEPCEVELFTDSEYLRDGVTEWLSVWKARGWRTADKKPVKNEDLWRQLDEAAARHRIQWHWLKGHAGHPLNERCDWRARAEIEALRKRSTPAQLAACLEEFDRARSPGRQQLGLFK